mmetsp:Transcript_71741/g.199046  ORF Transcript_71741/g.199046 Transcript_71741/m.199046 type:complete len:117 (+) Transcript_71741:45-395(+)|eukprot:CAMPEP_0117457220 /NCGR_PEP_ID=MMETSP0784-20121206/281_1 /TAXON_ID=39447 /ORGANISM="" /LENGTH=116 /DNA_ID=CAMNT_0005250657 /DNA_START=36 /DNA_END=386 /DNA_ORIENTATION=-
MADEGFHPNKSRVDEEKLGDFIRAQITGELQEVPGIGEKTEQVLREHGITTTWQLLAKYLSLKGEDVQAVEHNDRFYYWLKDTGTAAGYRAGVVHAIASKMDSAFSGLYDADVYES